MTVSVNLTHASVYILAPTRTLSEVEQREERRVRSNVVGYELPSLTLTQARALMNALEAALRTNSYLGPWHE